MTNPAINKLLSFLSAKLYFILDSLKFWDSNRIGANTLIVKYLDYNDLDNFEYTFAKSPKIGFDKHSDINLFIRNIIDNKLIEVFIENDFWLQTVTYKFTKHSSTLDSKDLKRLKDNKNSSKLISKEKMDQYIKEQEGAFDALSDDFNEDLEIHTDTINIELKTVRNNGL